MDRMYRYRAIIFSLGAVGFLLRAHVHWGDNVPLSTVYSQVALSIIFLTGAIEYEYKWRRGTVPPRLRRFLLGIAALCLLLIVYSVIVDVVQPNLNF